MPTHCRLVSSVADGTIANQSGPSTISRLRTLIEGWSNPRAWTILDARGRSPMCGRVASPLLGRRSRGSLPRLPLAVSVVPEQRPGLDTSGVVALHETLTVPPVDNRHLQVNRNPVLRFTLLTDSCF